MQHASILYNQEPFARMNHPLLSATEWSVGATTHPVVRSWEEAFPLSAVIAETLIGHVAKSTHRQRSQSTKV